MSGNGKTILLIEDDANDEELTLRALRRSGIQNHVAVVRDGEAALSYLFDDGPGTESNRSDRIGVIMLDLNLPKIGGLEVLARIRQNPQTRRLPVVILTSSRQDRDLVVGYEEGANAYVVKPVDVHGFITAIGQLGMFWTVTNEGPVPPMASRNDVTGG